MKQKIEKMLQMQDELNKKTIGENWRKESNKRWNLAIVIETAELIDSLDWKWWKKGKDDLVNAQIEIVDIWHFVLSLCLNKKAKYSYKELAEDIAFILSYNTSKIDRIDAALDLINTASRKQYTISMSEIIIIFKQLAISFNVSFNELYGLYVGKNVLNNFRRKMGYKDGTYTKIWKINDKKPMEDNMYMFEVIKNNINKVDNKLFDEFIYRELNNIYEGVNKWFIELLEKTMISY